MTGKHGATVTAVVFFNNDITYYSPGLLASDAYHLFQRGKRIFAHNLAELIDRALN